ncbi:uncharacterized protein LOC142625266 [Castanea sativa]|uniref:uncharacterized protein LOC142625266 n=1 Tax=Castanea sativa TaxID=21020 RepID=UPI003F6505E4
MSRPEVNEVLFAYIAVAIHAVSLVLIRDDSGVQRSVYYVSKSLNEAEVHYLPLEKAILAVVHATWKLPHYFQSHTVVVLTQLPLKLVLRKFTEPSLEEIAKELHMDEKSVGMITCKRIPVWKVYVDGAANKRGLGVELVLVSPEGMTFEKSLRLAFSTTNNEAEYEAVLVGMDMVQKMGSGNTNADSLATLATSSVQGLPRIILIEDLLKPALTTASAIRIHQTIPAVCTPRSDGSTFGRIA